MESNKNFDNNKDFLYHQLIKLGDMMGDGLHHEPDGKWIPIEYRRTLKALGLAPKRKPNVSLINKSMAKALLTTKCKGVECNGKLKQTRSGAMRAMCVECGQTYQFKRICSGGI